MKNEETHEIAADDLPPASVDTLHRYEPWPGNHAHCRLRIYDSFRGKVVVLSEQPGNAGMSVTNWAEGILTELRRQYGLDPATTAFFEHYPNVYYRHCALHSKLETQERRIDRLIPRWHEDLSAEVRWRPFHWTDENGTVQKDGLLVDDILNASPLDDLLAEVGLATVDDRPVDALDAWEVFA